MVRKIPGPTAILTNFVFPIVSVGVLIAGGTCRHFHEVYGYVKPGTLTALMGASGSGGEDAATIREYFARYGAVCPDDTNPAEYMLDAIGAGLAPRVGDRDWANVWRDSPKLQETVEEIERIKATDLKKPAEEKKNISKYSTPFLFQMKTVAERSFVTLWRSPNYVYTRLFIHVVISLIVSLSFLQLGTSSCDLQSQVFVM